MFTSGQMRVSMNRSEKNSNGLGINQRNWNINTKQADCLASHKHWKYTATSIFIIMFYKKILMLPGKPWERSPANMDFSPHAMQFTEIPSRRNTWNETSVPTCCACDTGVQLKLVTAPMKVEPVHSLQIRPLFRWTPLITICARTYISESQEMRHHLLGLFKYQI